MWGIFSLWELAVAAEVKSEFVLKRFGDSPEDYGFIKKYYMKKIGHPFASSNLQDGELLINSQNIKF